jgi:predicted NUDIX family NTP pyrophosphohydrolase
VVAIGTIRCVLILVAVSVVGGCSGGEEKAPRRVFTAADAARIANVRPVMPGWSWPKEPEKPEQPDSSSSSEPASPDPLEVAVRRQTADMTELASAGNKWRDDDKLANLAVTVFGSQSDARKAMPASNAFSRGWGKRSGRIVKDEEIDGLGDEAWRLWVAGQGLQVTYHWRRGNLWVEAHVHCWGTCPEEWQPFDAAARAWVDTIDEAARKGS